MHYRPTMPETRRAARFSRERGRIALAGCLAAGLVAAATHAGAVGDGDKSAPLAVVSQTIESIVDILSDTTLGKQQRMQSIQQIAYAHFDFETMSKLVLARDWKRLSDDQKVEFIQQFKLLLSRSYGGRLDRWGDEKIEVLGERQEPRGDVTVKTRILGGGFDGATIDYRLRESKSGQWKAIDVVAEGVSLVSSYRSQFREAMAGGGPEALLKRMAQKNAEADAELEGTRADRADRADETPADVQDEQLADGES